MRSLFSFRPRTCGALCALALSLATSGVINAAGVLASENFANFGDQQNFTCPAAPGGVCGAIAAINSFIYLEYTYPSIYAPTGTDLLTPNYVLATNNSPTDAANFATNGFGAYMGYYSRPGSATGDYIQTLTDWFNNYAPGTTDLNSWYVGSNDYDYSPGYADLLGEIQANEDVEFFVQGTGFYHVLTLTGISCANAAPLSTCSITYQDPNAPMTNQAAVLSLNGGLLQFTGVPGSGFAGTVSITAMFSESPVPEPATWLLSGLGIAALLRFKIRAKRH